MSEHEKKSTPAPPAAAASQPASPASQSAPEKSHATIASGTGETSVAPEGPGDSPAGDAVSLAVPSEFGRYKILRSLGQGAMGVVYLAEDTQLKRQVALKIPQLEATTGSARLERFYREARLAATLRHPNLCPIHDVGEFQGTHFISMAYIEGKPLDALLKSAKRQSERAAAGLVRRIALALEEAHSRDVIHRDLKPANIMIDLRGEPIVMDFGLARQMNSSDQAQITHSGAILGTPSYMSPEQVQGKSGEVAAASDIYALGVILYQLLAGRLPFEGPVISVLAQIATQAPPPPSSFRDTLSPELEAICLKAMAKRASDRFASMAEFAAALTQHLRKSPGQADHSRTNAEKAAASAGGEAAMSLPGDVSARSSSAGPASVIAARPGNRLAAKWRTLSRSAQIAAASLGVVALVALAVVILIERRDGRQTKIAVADGDDDDTGTVPRDRPESKRDKPVDGLRGSEEFEPRLTDGALSDVKRTEDQAKTVDLLALVEGAIEKSDGGRVLTVTQSRSPIEIPFPLPERVAEYDVTMKATRLGAGQGLGFTVPVPAVGKRVKFYLGGVRGSGIEHIDRKGFRNPEVNVKDVLFRSGFESRIVYRIRKDRIETVVDGRSVIHWTGDQRRLTDPIEKNFKIGCHNSEFEITELIVSLPADTAADDSSPAAANTTAVAADNSSQGHDSPAPATAQVEPVDPSVDDESAQKSDDADVNEKIKKLDKKIGGSKQKKGRAVPVDDLSLFPAGSVWRGSYEQAIARNKKGDIHQISLSVTERTKGRFKITVTIDGGRLAVYETQGTFYNGIVEWNTVEAQITKGAIGRHFYRGLISNGNRLEFQISGLARDGRETFCAGSADLQKK